MDSYHSINITIIDSRLQQYFKLYCNNIVMHLDYVFFLFNDINISSQQGFLQNKIVVQIKCLKDRHTDIIYKKNTAEIVIEQIDIPEETLTIEAKPRFTIIFRGVSIVKQPLNYALFNLFLFYVLSLLSFIVNFLN